MVNLAGRTPGLSSLAKRAGGIDSQRDLPRFAGQRFTTWYAHRPKTSCAPSAVHASSAPGISQPPEGRRVILWPDTFSNYFHPEVAQAAVTVLERAGFQVDMPTKPRRWLPRRRTQKPPSDTPLCCGLTWISTGQLGMARRMLRRTVKALLPDLRAGVPVVVLEPSCAAVFRADAAELLGSDDARLLAERTRTLAELLIETGWQPDGLPGSLSREGQARARSGRAIAQVHCHQHAIMGFGADTEILRRCGVDVDVLDTGCCGLAGNFGFERGHYEVSAACAERGLWPAVRAADPETAILADGFSCRTQLAAGRTGRDGLHLAQLLAQLTADTEEMPSSDMPSKSAR
jgi:Fe-S oxidoreductase